MNKKDLKNYFLRDNQSGYKTRENHVKKQFPSIYGDIINYHLNDDDMKFNQKLYNYLYDIKEIPNCLTCSKKIKWRGVFSEGYKEYCNLKCGGKGIKRLNNIKKTVNEKYGVDYVSQHEDIKNKTKETNNERYGVDSVFLNDKIIDKIKKTNIEKYGVEIPIKSEIIKNRRKENNLKKYGVDNPSKLQSTKDKLKKTNLKKYGVDSVMKVKSIKDKLLYNKLKKFIEVNSLNNIKIYNYDDSQYIIKNQCNIHDEYIIDKYLFYHRTKYGIENSCIICNPIKQFVSIKENEIKNWIKEDLNVDFIQNDRIILNGKELDIFIPDHNLGIEFNGLYWHSDANVENSYHLTKTELVNIKNIILLHIFEDEWVFKSDIVKSIIKSKLGMIDNRIYARKCKIKEVQPKESREFLEKNHIQGNVNASIKLGLYYDSELVSLMTFGKKRKVMGSKSEESKYEMYRFCNKLNTIVIGGASKLFKYFIKNYNPNEVISYADRRYFDGNLYENLGFEFTSSTKPNYWYFKKNTLTRMHRFNFRKDKLIKEGYDKNKTEREIMSELGYLRIYDCGNLKFTYSN